MVNELPALAPEVEVYSGDDTVFESIFVDDGLGVAIDMSAHTFEAVWRPSPSSRTEITLTVDDSAANTGIIVVSANAAQTAQMESDGVWDLQCTFAADVSPYTSGDVVTLVRVPTKFVLDVTR